MFPGWILINQRKRPRDRAVILSSLVEETSLYSSPKDASGMKGGNKRLHAPENSSRSSECYRGSRGTSSTPSAVAQRVGLPPWGIPSAWDSAA